MKTDHVQTSRARRYSSLWCVLALPLTLILLSGCTSLPPNVERIESFAPGDTADTLLGRGVSKRTTRHPGKSGFYLLPDGYDAFVARAVLAEAAERSIDAQYYLLHDDLVGRLFLNLLLEAANRGVRIRLLLDDMALNDNKDIGVAALDAHPNVQIRVFNPFDRGVNRLFQFVSRFGEATRRMHNKSFTVDNQVSVIGGRNIGNEYFKADPDLAFGDLDVIAIGPEVRKVSSVFDLYWNSVSAYPISSLVPEHSQPDLLGRLEQTLSEYVAEQQDSAYLQALRDSQLATTLRSETMKYDWGSAQVVYDDPAKITADRERDDLKLTTQIKPYFDRIEKELIIFSPYFVPGQRGVENLRQLRERGVRVRILTNSLASTDVGAVHAGYARYRRPLLKAGVELYEIDRTLTREQRSAQEDLTGSSKASLHAKSFLIDREKVFIGSLNLDPRSVVENTEVGMMIESSEIAERMSGWFDHIALNNAFRLALEPNRRGDDAIVWHRTQKSEVKTYTTEPNTSFWRRFGIGLLRLLPIESQL